MDLDLDFRLYKKSASLISCGSQTPDYKDSSCALNLCCSSQTYANNGAICMPACNFLWQHENNSARISGRHKSAIFQSGLLSIETSYPWLCYWHPLSLDSNYLDSKSRMPCKPLDKALKPSSADAGCSCCKTDSGPEHCFKKFMLGSTRPHLAAATNCICLPVKQK